MNNQADQLLALCYTQSEAARALRIIKDYLNQRFFSKPPTPKPPSPQQTSLINQLGQSFFDHFQADKLADQITELEEEINQTKLVTIYLPLEMPPQELERLGQWIKANLGAQTLFEPKLDPSLIGGCALSLKGVYKDYSLRQLLKDNHEAVMKSLTSFKA